MKLAKRLDNFPEYIFSKLAKKRIEVEEKTGKKVLDLSIGSPDFPPSRLYTEKLKEYMDEDKSHLYPGYGAIREFSEALQEHYRTRFGVHLEKNELFPLLGGKDGVSHLPFALLDEGDEVLIPDPGYPGFSGPVLMLGTQPVYYDLIPENNFKPDISELEKKITPKTKYIWINFPANPTGKVAELSELEALVRFAEKKNILLLYDNAYSEITFDGYTAPSILQIDGAKNIAVEIGSFSKTFSFAGHRMGWIVGNSIVVNALAKVKSQIDSGMYLPLQKLGAFALSHRDTTWHSAMLQSYKSRRDILVSKLTQLSIQAVPAKGSLYLWAEIPNSEQDSEAFTFKLLEEKQILFAPGTGFGKNGKRFVRVSISSNIDEINKYL